MELVNRQFNLFVFLTAINSAMIQEKFICKLNFPKIPQSLVQEINFNKITKKIYKTSPDLYFWSDEQNQSINDWCKKNIIEDCYYAFQCSNVDLYVHKDEKSSTKLIYILDQGGDNVITKFFKQDKCTEIFSEKLDLHTWYILKTDIYHGVFNQIRPRYSICSTVFSNQDY